MENAEIIKSLQNNTRAYKFLTVAEKKCFTSAPRKYQLLLWRGVWTQRVYKINPDYTYKLDAKYQPRNLKECAVFVDTNGQLCFIWIKLEFALTAAPSFDAFVGYKYADGRVTTNVRIDSTACNRAMVPTHVIFAE